MTFLEFLKENNIEPMHTKQKTLKVDEMNINISWVVGGQYGGSCWDEGPSTYYSVTPDKEPDFLEFENLLAKYSPDITYLNYKAAARELIVADVYEQNEYYGNYTTYATKTVNLKKFYDFFNLSERT